MRIQPREWTTWYFAKYYTLMESHCILINFQQKNWIFSPLEKTSKNLKTKIVVADILKFLPFRMICSYSSVNLFLISFYSTFYFVLLLLVNWLNSDSRKKRERIDGGASELQGILVVVASHSPSQGGPQFDEDDFRWWEWVTWSSEQQVENDQSRVTPVILSHGCTGHLYFIITVFNSKVHIRHCKNYNSTEFHQQVWYDFGIKYTAGSNVDGPSRNPTSGPNIFESNCHVPFQKLELGEKYSALFLGHPLWIRATVP